MPNLMRRISKISIKNEAFILQFEEIVVQQHFNLTQVLGTFQSLQKFFEFHFSILYVFNSCYQSDYQYLNQNFCNFLQKKPLNPNPRWIESKKAQRSNLMRTITEGEFLIEFQHPFGNTQLKLEIKKKIDRHGIIKVLILFKIINNKVQIQTGMLEIIIIHQLIFA